MSSEQRGLASESLHSPTAHSRLVSISSSAADALLGLQIHGAAIAHPATGRMMRVNEALCRISGYPPAELRGRAVNEFVSELLDCESSDLLRELKRGRCILVRCYRPDRSSLELLAEALAIEEPSDGTGELLILWQEAKRTETAAPEGTTEDRSSHRARAALDAAHVGIWAWHVGQNEQWWDSACYEILGYDPREVRASFSAWQQLVIEEDRERFSAAFQDYLSGASEFCEAEYRITDPHSGETRWLASRGRVTHRDEAGNAVLISGTVLDTTKMRRLDDAVRKSEENMRLAQRIGQIGSWEVDLDADTLAWSEETFRIFGRDPLTFKPTNEAFFEAVHPEDREAVREASQQAALLGGPYRVEHRIIRPDGEERYLVEHAGIVQDATGRPVRMMGMVQDVTEQKLAQRKLIENEARLAALVGSAMDAIISFDERRRIILFNRTAEAMFGYAAADIIGRQLDLLLGIDETAREEDLVERLRQSRTSAVSGVGGVKGVRASGEDFPIEATLSHADVDGLSIFTVIVRDVSEQQELQRQLLKAQKMEALGQLSGGIAHDFNNILGSIVGYSELAALELPPGTPARRSIDAVLQASYRARDLVSQILSFSRQTPGKPVPLHVSEIVDEVAQLLRASIPSNVEIRRAAGAANDAIVADPIQVHQLLMNLATNSAQAMRERGGELAFELSNQSLTEQRVINGSVLPRGEYLRITVSDTGAGIDPAVLPQIFEPFFTTKAPGEGTGLGLALVARIVRGLGGAVEIDSRVGYGTRCVVLVPLYQGKVEQVRPTTDLPTRRAARDISVMVVDDEEMLLSLTAQMLQHLGYQVSAFREAEEALAAFRARPEEFDMVITDQTMPRLSGERLAEEIEGLRPGTPVILCSGYSAEILRKSGDLTQGRRVLPKPFSLAQLQSAVDESIAALPPK